MLRLVVELNGERVVGLTAVVGYLHTGFEKNMEHKTWWKAITYPERIDYVSFQNNELVFVLAIEKLLGIEPPPKAQWMRMLLCELNRIHSHLVWLGTAALELGAISMFWYCFRERDAILDLFELATGVRMHTRYFQAGGLAEDIPVGFYDECRSFADTMMKRVDEYEALLSGQAIWLERTKGIGLLSAADAIAHRASPAPCCARPESTGTCGRCSRTSPTTRSTSTCPSTRTATSSTATRCTWTRCASRRASSSQALDGMPDGAWIVDDRKVVLPPRHELHTSMESLIHHFKLVTEGYRVPEGEVYVTVESPRGELGCYVVSDGGSKPWRVKFRAPSFVALGGDGDVHERRAHRRPDRHRRLARHGHGGGRPVVAEATLYDRIRTVASEYPESRSAVLPALRLAQAEHGGWLPPEAFREVAEALELTPAYCHAVASFYDMFHLEPVGKHMVEVCTNISCALVGAQQVVEAFERELGVEAGGTTPDGEVTLRTVECYGGCGWGTVVSVDHRYREPVRPEDVPGIVRELRDAD